MYLSSIFSKKATKIPETSNTKIVKLLALKLHLYSNLTVKDMETIFKRAQLNVIIEAIEKLVVKKCSSCKSTRKPLGKRKTSFKKVLVELNHILQVEFIEIISLLSNLKNQLILHFVDIETYFSATAIVSSHEHHDIKKSIEYVRWNIYRDPHTFK